MTARLTELRVECFRGATNRAELQFDPAKPLVVIFGENGTGKSTLVDALDLIANQPGLSFFHCHIQQHMDYGFKALFRYA